VPSSPGTYGFRKRPILSPHPDDVKTAAASDGRLAEVEFLATPSRPPAAPARPSGFQRRGSRRGNVRTTSPRRNPQEWQACAQRLNRHNRRRITSNAAEGAGARRPAHDKGPGPENPKWQRLFFIDFQQRDVVDSTQDGLVVDQSPGAGAISYFRAMITVYLGKFTDAGGGSG
jgi:hypothetical protein